MKNLRNATILSLLFLGTIVYAAPTVTYIRTTFPETDNTYSLGSSSLRFLSLYARNASTTDFYSSGNATTTYATSTTLFSTTASTTNLFLSTGNTILKSVDGLVTSAVGGTDYEFPLTFDSPLNRSTNTVTCPTCLTSVGFGNNWQFPSGITNAIAPTTTVGIIVSASSTFVGNVNITGNATATNATTTNLAVSSNAAVSNFFQVSGRMGLRTIGSTNVALDILTANATIPRGIRVSGDNVSNFALTSFLTGDGQLRFITGLDGKESWGDGTNVADVMLGRSGTNELTLTGNLKITANATATNATTTNLFATTASTTNLYLSTGLGCLQVSSAGLVTSTGSNCSSGSGSAYPFPLTGNATSTLTQFNGGLTAYGSSTIGDSSTTGGLTVSGTATTTHLVVAGRGNTGEPAITVGSSDLGFFSNGSTILYEKAGSSLLDWDGSALYPNDNNSVNLGVDSTNIWNHLYANYASTTALTATTLCLTGDTCITTWPSGTSFGYLFPSNATTTKLTFSGGLLSLASTTIGDGTDGLTINGGATTTNNAYFGSNVGIGTSTPQWPLQIANGTKPQLALSDSSDNSFAPVTFRNTNGNFYIATASPTTFATSSYTMMGFATTGDIFIGDTGTPVSVFGVLAAFGIERNRNEDLGLVVKNDFLDRAAQITTVANSEFSRIKVTTLSDSNSFFIGLNGSNAFSVLDDSTGNVPFIIDAGASNGTIELDSSGTLLNNLANAASGHISLCYTASGGRLDKGASATSCTPSSIRYKENVLDSTAGLNELMKLRPVMFYFKDHNTPEGDKQQNLGLIAEEVMKTDPRLVQLDSTGLPGALKLDNFIGLLIKSVQDVAKEVIALTKRVTTVESTIDKQQKEIDALQKEIDSLKRDSKK